MQNARTTFSHRTPWLFIRCQRFFRSMAPSNLQEYLMTKRIFFAALLASLTTSVSIYAIQPASAVALPQATAEASIASPFLSLDHSYPEPQEPLDHTPITPTETVGAAQYEPF
ncbi:hypothetical protein J2W24_006367 [Variovorax boronicumulans]|uniref:hypothetical protein n=1 Tax=Variovorax boronicumulans TaxID=436515 RepID=UPI00278393F4|nr:hypothetical protein [Variovorax boronicumulans]MDP9920685.1 hypothetical protein [Variovorax boronicumulans]